MPEKSNKNERIVIEGIVKKTFPNEAFEVELGGGHKVLAYLCGKMHIKHIQVVIGDRVLTELSPYDLSRGRITTRL